MCGPIEDHSPVGFAKKLLNSGSSDRLLSSKATINSIANSKYSFTRFDVDSILLSLLKVLIQLFPTFKNHVKVFFFLFLEVI